MGKFAEAEEEEEALPRPASPRQTRHWRCAAKKVRSSPAVGASSPSILMPRCSSQMATRSSLPRGGGGPARELEGALAASPRMASNASSDTAVDIGIEGGVGPRSSSPIEMTVIGSFGEIVADKAALETFEACLFRALAVWR